MSYVYKSQLANYFNALLQQKRMAGFSYEGGAFNLSQFDKLCMEQFPESETVTKELAMAWATIRSQETKAGFTGRLCAIRELARFMNREGVPAYVIPFDIGKPPAKNFVPHIFTNDELVKLFFAADHIMENQQVPMNHLVTPVIFRLMLTCGLRPQEALYIKCKNINIKEGTIFIPEAKHARDRIVVMSDDMRRLCERFDEVLQLAKPNREYFFSGNTTPCFYGNWLRTELERLRVAANITEYRGNKPRPYDFRHTFATRTLYRWTEEGRDLENMLPYLRAYMGHTKFESTAYYIHLIPEFFPQMKELVQNQYDYLIPEVESDEAY